MKKLLLKQLMTKRLVLLVLSFILLMPSTAWGEEYTYDSFGDWSGNAGMYSCLTIDFQNSTTVYSPEKFSNISKVEIVAGGASQIYSSFAVSVNGSDYQSIVSTTGNGYVIPENVNYDTYTFEFTPDETPQSVVISAQYNAVSGMQGWVYIKSVTVYTEEKTKPEFYAVLSADGKTVTFYYDDQKASRGGKDIFSTPDKFYAEATTAIIDESMANYAPAYMTAWFFNCSALTSIKGLENLNTSEVMGMQSLFQGCSSLTRLDLTGFDTSSLTNMNGMFAYCSSLTSIDLSSFNTSKVTDMGGLFAFCSDLVTIYVNETKWSTAAVTSENNGNSGLFYECGPLVGGNGTAYYDTYEEDLAYARVDKPSQPGYLTQKNGPAMESCDMSEITTDNAYYATTSFLCERGILDGSKVDGKYKVEEMLLRQHLANITFRGLFTLNGREIPSTFVSDQYPDIYDDLKSDAPYYQAAKTLLYLDYGDGITPFDRDRDGFFPDGNESRINILKELMEAFNIKPDTEGKNNPFPNDPDIAHLSETSPIKMGYVRQAAKLGIITTENTAFRPYSDCLRGEAFLMLARIIQKIEAGEITDPNPQESDFLDPNSGTGTEDPNANAEPYAALSENNTVLTFYYDDQKEQRNGMGIGPFTDSSKRGWDERAWWTITTAVIDPSFANCMTITSTAFWFSDCRNLTSITGLQYLKTDNVTDMKSMFFACQKLESVDLSGFITDNVTDMSHMFSGCWKLSTVDLSGFNTSNVTNMSYMFAESPGFQSLDVRSFNTSNVTDMSWMFSGLSSVKSIELRGFNTSNVTNMSYMFRYCCNMPVIDISSFKTNNVTVMDQMFHECYGLKTIYVGDGWSTVAVTSSTDMFSFDSSLVGGAGSGYYACDAKDHTVAHIDGGADNPGYFTYVIQPYAVLSPDNTTLTFYYDDQKEYRGGMGINNSFCSPSPYGTAITAIIDASFADYRPTSTACWFMHCSSLTGITGMENLMTENVTDMSYMFENCSSLESLDLSHFNTENVTDMTCMFENCYSLKSLDVTSFNTQNVTTMSAMLWSCSSLTSLDVSSFNTQNVIDMDNMFYYCSSLTTIYAGSEWSTAAVKNGGTMFLYCTNLKGGAGTTYNGYSDHTYARIDGGADNPGYFTDKNATPVEDGSEPYAVLTGNDDEITTDEGTIKGKTLTFYYDNQKEDRGGMSVVSSSTADRGWGIECEKITKAVFDGSFANCTTLTSTRWWFLFCKNLKTIIGITNLKTDNVTNMTGMFYGCSSLTSLDLSSLNTSSLNIMYGIFQDCSSLKSINLTNFKTDNVEDMGQLFLNCSSLESLDVSGFKTDEVTSMFNMFRGCSSLTSLDLSGFNTDNVTNMMLMFDHCSNLKTIYAGEGWSISKVKSSPNVFRDCTNLVGGAGTAYNAQHTDYTYAHIDGGTDNPGYFTAKAGGSGDKSEGDLNGDGEVDDADTEVLVSVVMGGDKDKLADADLNHDGKVDAADIVTLVNIIRSQE